MTLKADLHIHTEYSTDCLTPLARIIDRCRRTGMDCIAVTDHNEIKGALLLQEKAPFKVIVGEEIRTNRGEIIGYFLKERIRPGLSPAETVYEIKNQGGLVCVPHPFDKLRSSRLEYEGLMEIVSEIDILEIFNARNVYSADNQEAREFAHQHGFSVSVGSDAHWFWEIGRTYFNIPDFSGPAEFREGLTLKTPNITGSLRKSGLLVHAATKTLKWVGKKPK